MPSAFRPCKDHAVTAPVVLPKVATERGLRALLTSRRSTKHFDPALPLTLGEASAVLWAAGGTTAPQHRVAPSAKATYPVAVTLVAGDVDGLMAGCYAYDSARHVLTPGRSGDHRRPLATATLDAGGWLTECPALLLLTADLDAAHRRFPDQPTQHGERFVWMEAGHAIQNVYLTAAERRLSTCLVAGLDDEEIATASRTLVPDHHAVLGIMALGFAASE